MHKLVISACNLREKFDNDIQKLVDERVDQALEEFKHRFPERRLVINVRGSDQLWIVNGHVLFFDDHHIEIDIGGRGLNFKVIREYTFLRLAFVDIKAMGRLPTPVSSDQRLS